MTVTLGLRTQIYSIFGGLLLVLCWLIPAQSAEVLMVHWFENTEADVIFQEELRKLRPDVKFRHINAKRDKKLLRALLKTFDFSKVDLIHTMGTNGTKIVKEHIRGGKPIIFDAVSTPVLSGIVKSVAKPSGNMTGARMLIDLETQIDVLSDITNLKTLGVWYDPREYQSQVVLLKIKKIADKKGIELKPFRIIPDAGMFDRMVKSAVLRTSQLDALYFIASSSFHLNYKKLHKHLPKSLVTMGALREYVEHGSTFALGPDPREMVRKVAARAHRVLEGQNAGDMPLALLTRKNAILYVNKKKANPDRISRLKTLGMKVVEIE